MNEYDFTIVALREVGRKKEVTYRGLDEKRAIESYARSIFENRPSKYAEMLRLGLDIEVLSSCHSNPRPYHVNIEIEPDGELDFMASLAEYPRSQKN